MDSTEFESSAILAGILASVRRGVARRSVAVVNDAMPRTGGLYDPGFFSFVKHNLTDDDVSELVDFLNYLLHRNRPDRLPVTPVHNGSAPGLGSNRTDLRISAAEDALSENVKVGLLQLLILVLVFFFFFLICKCNHILESCRNRLDSKRSAASDLEDARFREKKSLRHYCCFFWYEFKMRRRFKKRRLRNRRFGRNTATSSGQRRHAKGITFDHNKTIRRNNSILKRRSMMTRNRVYSTVKFSGSVSSAHHHAKEPTTSDEAAVTKDAGGETGGAVVSENTTTSPERQQKQQHQDTADVINETETSSPNEVVESAPANDADEIL